MPCVGRCSAVRSSIPRAPKESLGRAPRTHVVAAKTHLQAVVLGFFCVRVERLGDLDEVLEVRGK